MPSGSAPRKKAAGHPREAPTLLLDLDRQQWKQVAKGVYERFGEVQLTDRAAALAYYGFLSLFPALIVAIAALALVGNYPETYRVDHRDAPRCGPRDRGRHDRQRPARRRLGGSRPAACSGSGSCSR